MDSSAVKKISILGCGWLGLPLAERLLGHPAQYVVKGSTTTPEKRPLLASAGLDPYLISFTPSPQGERLEAFLASDYLVVDIPPRQSRQGEDFHPQQIRYLVSLLEKSTVKNIIYISSTSVYPALNRAVTENDVLHPEESAAPALVRAEQQIASLRPGRQVTILRCAGLMGYDRIPGKYVKGQKNLTTAEVPVNYVHRDDVIRLIVRILEEKKVPNETYNVVAPAHPTRREVYEASCVQFGWEKPTFREADQAENHKVVLADKVQAHYGFSFLYPDPLHFYYQSTSPTPEDKA